LICFQSLELDQEDFQCIKINFNEKILYWEVKKQSNSLAHENNYPIPEFLPELGFLAKLVFLAWKAGNKIYALPLNCLNSKSLKRKAPSEIGFQRVI